MTTEATATSPRKCSELSKELQLHYHAARTAMPFMEWIKELAARTDTPFAVSAKYYLQGDCE